MRPKLAIIAPVLKKYFYPLSGIVRYIVQGKPFTNIAHFFLKMWDVFRRFFTFLRY